MMSPRPSVDRQAFWASHGFAQADVRRVLDNARRLKAAARDGKGGRPLLGKNLALLRISEAQPEGSALQQAGAELGAQVAHICLGERLKPSDPELREIARMLGRLYDAVDCGVIGHSFAAQIERHSGIPVFRGLARTDHPVGALADLMCILERCPGGGATTPIAFACDVPSLRSEAFLQAAKQLNFDLRATLDTEVATDDQAFLVDACDGDHWRLHGPAGWIDDSERTANNQFVMQAVLVDAINQS